MYVLLPREDMLLLEAKDSSGIGGDFLRILETPD